MREKKLQVFVSSTYTDLIEERQAAVEAILTAGHIPAGMELFTAGDESQMAVIKRWIDESDVYLLILGGRYGSIEPTTGKSYTHLEYDYAVETNKPLFAVVIHDHALDNKVQLKGKSVLETENPKELKNFRSIVSNNMVRFWKDEKDIKIAILETLAEFSYRKNLTGWVRANNSIDTGLLAEQIAQLTKENSDLRNKLANESGAGALYAGVKYDQLVSLLKSQVFDFEDSKITLFEFIIKYGERLSSGMTLRYPDSKILQKLVVYMIVNTSPTGLSESSKFTDDGHRFYVKTLQLLNSTED